MAHASVDRRRIELWRADLEREVGAPVEVVFGRSRTYPIQARRGGPDGATHLLRLHEVFAAAPAEVRRSVGRWLRSGRRARRANEIVGAWMETALCELDPPPRPTPKPRGRCHDLTEIRAELVAGPLARDFRLDPPPGTARGPAPDITWGRRAKSSGRRSLRLGSYYSTEHLIRVHPVLDQPAVPRWFVRSVVFHELLHAVLPSQKTASGRWVHHGPEFRRREEAHPDHARALAWQDANLPRLLRSARSGIPMRVRPADAASPAKTAAPALPAKAAKSASPAKAAKHAGAAPRAPRRPRPPSGDDPRQLELF